MDTGMVRVVSIPYFYHLDELQQLIPMVCVRARACVHVRGIRNVGWSESVIARSRTIGRLHAALAADES